jgi:hypothetical protein
MSLPSKVAEVVDKAMGDAAAGGCGGPNSRVLGLVPQEEVDKVTTVKNRYYPVSEYNKLTLAKKAKHFQLKNPRKIPGTGLAGRKAKKGSASVTESTSVVTSVSAAALAISELTAATTKQTSADEGGTNDDGQNVGTNSQWGRNRVSPTIAGRQGSVPKKQKN